MASLTKHLALLRLFPQNQLLGGTLRVLRLSSVLFVVVVCVVTQAECSIEGWFSTNITFNVSTSHVGAAWSEAAETTPRGLLFAGGDWIQTERIPVGLAWRPPTASGVIIGLDGNFEKHFVESDIPLSAYIRYGCDGIHWSTWIPMIRGVRGLAETYPFLAKIEGTIVFSIVLRVAKVRKRPARHLLPTILTP